MLRHKYIEAQSGSYRYSRFCDLDHGCAAWLLVTIRQTHIDVDRLFVDYGGDKVPVVVDRLTGEIRDTYIFVEVL